MRIATVADRAVFVVAENRVIDLHEATGGRFGPTMRAVLDDWDAFNDLARTLDPDPATATRISPTDLQAPVPEPRQIFAVGLNYADHAAEASLAVPEFPVVFTKFPTSLTGPEATIQLPSDNVDYEAELVVVISTRGRNVTIEDAWGHVAGLMVGQDLSEREIQSRGPAPQFTMGKSFPGFAPCGPALATIDEVAVPDDLAIGCSVDGEVLQGSRTAEMIFSIPELIAYISSICEVTPGDLIFTGTPAGVGLGRTPRRFLRSGETLVTTIEGLGSLRNPLT